MWSSTAKASRWRSNSRPLMTMMARCSSPCWTPSRPFAAAWAVRGDGPKKSTPSQAYDARHCRAYLRQRGIKSRIARKGIDSSERLGRHRWVVERTLAWLNRFRRLTIRYERRADIYEAFLHLGCILVCWNFIQLKGFC